MNKPQLRKWAKIKRSELDMDSLSLILAEKLKQTEEYKNANNIMIFYPLKDEVNLLSLLDDETKTFYLPKIDGDNLLCCKYKKGEPLCESSFHTMEPITTPRPKGERVEFLSECNELRNSGEGFEKLSRLTAQLLSRLAA